MVYPALLPLMRTPRLPAVDWTDLPADLNDSSVSAKDKIWFLRVCHHILKAVYLLWRPDDLHVTQPRCIRKERNSFRHTSQGTALEMPRTPAAAVALSQCKVLCSFIMQRHGLGWSIHNVQCGCWMYNIALVCLVYRCYVMHFITISLGRYLFSSQESSALSLGGSALWGSHWFLCFTQHFEGGLVSGTQRWKTKYNIFCEKVKEKDQSEKPTGILKDNIKTSL